MSAAPASRQASASRPWTHYVNDDFFDRPDLDPNLERLAFRLERLARDKPWCFSSNDELMGLLGCSHNTLAAVLNRGESRGWFRRVLIPGRHGRATGRIGFVLFVRPTDRPVATPETFHQVVELMRADARRGHAGNRPRTLPFPAPVPPESTGHGPQFLGTTVPKNWGPPVPKNWVPPSSKEEITGEETGTTTTRMHGTQPPADVSAPPMSSSSVLDPGSEETGRPGAKLPGEVPAPEVPAAETSTHLAVPSPAPIEFPAAPAPAPAETSLPAELVTAAAAAIPGASREWLTALLRGCGSYGLDLALLVVAWVKIQRADKPGRYARVALSGWLNQLRAGELTLEDVRAEVHGRPGSRGSPRPFDPSVCLARLASLGWALVPHGPDQVIRSEIPGRVASLWKHVPGELRQQLEEHKAELKAYVLRRASERGRTVALRA